MLKTALKQQKTRKGYMLTSFNIDGEGKMYMANEPISFWSYYTTLLRLWLAKRN